MINTISILTFHSLDDSGSAISFPPERFQNIIRELQGKGYQSIGLSEVADWISGKISFHSPTVAITFDDGFENVYHHAFPVLEEAGFRATVFLTTGHCGAQNDWPSQSPGVPILPMLTWQQILEMGRAVFSVQAHTKTHPYLSRLSLTQAQEEIVSSKKDIEDHLGKPVDFFCYPYGDFNQHVYDFVRENFNGACSVQIDVTTAASDVYRLPRIDMYYFSGTTTSVFFISPLFKPYLHLRKILRRVRQLGMSYSYKVE